MKPHRVTVPLIVGLVSRLFLGTLFLGSGLIKAIRPFQEFAATIEIYEIVPSFAILPLARIFPVVEILVGVGLIGGLFTLFFSRLARILSALFFFVIGSALIRQIPLESCGCFGEWVQLAPWQTMVLDSILFGLTFLVPWAKDRFALDGFFRDDAIK